MINAGNFIADAIVSIPFNTFDSNGASVTVTELVAGDVHIHKDGGVTQRASSSGITVSIDFDGIVGNHLILIDTSDNDDPGFYAAGADYEVRLEGILVNAQTLNAFVAIFSIENRFMRGTDSVDTAAMRGTDGVDTATMRGTNNAALASIATEARLAELDAANLPADIDAIPTTAMRGTDSAATEAKQDILDSNVDNLNLGIIYGIAETGTLSVTQCTSDLTGFTDGQLKGAAIIFTSGPADGERKTITGYESASGLITFDALTLAPEDGDTFKIV